VRVRAADLLLLFRVFVVRKASCAVRMLVGGCTITSGWIVSVRSVTVLKKREHAVLQLLRTLFRPQSAVVHKHKFRCTIFPNHMVSSDYYFSVDIVSQHPHFYSVLLICKTPATQIQHNNLRMRK
jgi:hypothetical protein